MNDMFPAMFDRPEGKTVVGGGLYWVVYVVGFPFVLTLMFGGSDANAIPILLLYGVSFVAVGLIFRRYLIESFFHVRCYPGRFFATVGIASGVVLTVEQIALFACLHSNVLDVMYASNNILPVAEVPSLLSTSAAVTEMPLLMLLCTSLFVPVTMCCLYYGVGFAPAAAERPWLGYIIVAILAAVPRLFGLGNTGYPLYQLMVYLLQLPWHLCACWAYQKADTIWAPICIYAVVNFLSALSTMIAFYLLH